MIHLQPERSVEGVTADAAALARHPDIVRRLIKAHQPDDDGNCKDCVAYRRRSIKWPCALYVQAKAAMDLYMQD